MKIRTQDRILVASALRSGSTHMCQTLCNLLGRHLDSGMIALTNGFGADEHVINPLMANALFPRKEFIFHQHCKGTKIHIDILQSYGFKVIVTTRNIYDIMQSVKDRMDDGIYVPCIVSPPKWKDIPEETKWHWLAENVVPWHLQFGASWLKLDGVYWFKYEDYYKDEVAGMREILTYVEANVFSDREIRKAADINVNKKFGVVGRGQANCPSDIKDSVEWLFESWGILEDGLRNIYA